MNSRVNFFSTTNSLSSESIILNEFTGTEICHQGRHLHHSIRNRVALFKASRSVQNPRLLSYGLACFMSRWLFANYKKCPLWLVYRLKPQVKRHRQYDSVPSHGNNQSQVVGLLHRMSCELKHRLRFKSKLQLHSTYFLSFSFHLLHFLYETIEWNENLQLYCYFTSFVEELACLILIM